MNVYLQSCYPGYPLQVSLHKPFDKPLHPFASHHWTNLYLDNTCDSVLLGSEGTDKKDTMSTMRELTDSPERGASEDSEQAGGLR